MSKLRVGTKNSVVTNGYDRLPTLTVDFVVIDDELRDKLLNVWQFGYDEHDRAVKLLTGLADKLAELLDDVESEEYA